MVESTGATTQSDQSSAREQVYAASNVVNEFTIDDARSLSKPPERILCTLADNRFIRFGAYSVCDYDSRTELLSVTAEQNKYMDDFAR